MATVTRWPVYADRPTWQDTLEQLRPGDLACICELKSELDVGERKTSRWGTVVSIERDKAGRPETFTIRIKYPGFKKPKYMTRTVPWPSIRAFQHQ